MIKFDDEVKWILGRPNFMVCPVAHLFRKLGQKIKEKAEEEQAFVIYWMLCLYEKHGKNWREEMHKEICRMSDKLENKKQVAKS